MLRSLLQLRVLFHALSKLSLILLADIVGSGVRNDGGDGETALRTVGRARDKRSQKMPRVPLARRKGPVNEAMLKLSIRRQSVEEERPRMDRHQVVSKRRA